MLRKSVLFALGILSVFAPNGIASSNSITCPTVINISNDYKDGCVEVNNEIGRSFRCGSLQDGLEFTSDQRGENCTEIVLSSGEQFWIDRAVTINSSVVLRSSEPGPRSRVTVTVEGTPQPPNYPPFYVLTVLSTEVAVIESVEFSGSSGIISILKVGEAIVSDCQFRWAELTCIVTSFDVRSCIIYMIRCALLRAKPWMYIHRFGIHTHVYTCMFIEHNVRVFMDINFNLSSDSLQGK